jgi:hypothetical protein
LYLCVLIVFSLRRESFKLILVNEPFPKVVLSQSTEARLGQKARGLITIRALSEAAYH